MALAVLSWWTVPTGLFGMCIPTDANAQSTSIGASAKSIVWIFHNVQVEEFWMQNTGVFVQKIIIGIIKDKNVTFTVVFQEVVKSL